MSARHASRWSLGRTAADRLFNRRILPGRYLDWAAWEAMAKVTSGPEVRR